MAVKYRMYQSKKEDNFKGKWYARATHDGTVSTNDLADIIQDNCTVKRADVLAVISELVEVMTAQLQNSKRVKLDRFGTFKLGINTKPANTAKEFTVATNVKNVHVIFLPEVTIDTNGTRQKTFVKGAKLQEATQYSVDKTDSSDTPTE